MRYLFRGVSEELYKRLDGKLVPKALAPFEHCFTAGEGIIAGCGAVAGVTTRNAVIRHQLGQEGVRTSGISTTPHFERARFYATHGGLSPAGYVYKIDCDLLTVHGISAFVVSEHTPHPSIPADDEVILVAPDHRALPHNIVVEIVPVQSSIL